MYHEVKPAKSGKDAITPYEFESDLKYLKENGYTAIDMSELIAYVNDGKELPEKPVIISFDDGYYNNYVYVFPIIKKYNTKIVLSIIGKSTDDFTCDPAKNLDYTHLSWTQINEMLDSGLVEIQNHTYNMHHNTSARFGCAKNYGESSKHYEEALSNDLQKLQDEIRLFTGEVPNTFTYPYGKISDESLPIIEKLGFKASLSCTYGINVIQRKNFSLYGLKRICRVHGTGAKKSIDGAMKTLKYANNN
jgi:peptidoglycan/xylan/chitin deacetylase (PgdA/CDA1 family)